MAARRIGGNGRRPLGLDREPDPPGVLGQRPWVSPSGRSMSEQGPSSSHVHASGPSVTVDGSAPGRREARAGIVLVPAALGIAFQVSGIGGGRWAIAAWVVVALCTSVSVVGALRWIVSRHGASRGGNPADTPPSIDSRLDDLGTDLVSFARDRDRAKPTVRLHGARRLREHQADTCLLYDERFAPAVVALVYELRSSGRLGTHEAKSLTAAPRHTHDIRTVGWRLIELAHLPSPNSVAS